MMKRLIYVTATCLLLAGCNAMGRPAHDATGGLSLIPSGLGIKSKKDKMIEAVEKDPFPDAAEVNLRI